MTIELSYGAPKGKPLSALQCFTSELYRLTGSKLCAVATIGGTLALAGRPGLGLAIGAMFYTGMSGADADERHDFNKATGHDLPRPTLG